MAITLGSSFSSNGRTVIGGLGGSGLDTETLLNNLVEARSIPKVKLEDKVKLNDSKLTAYGELRTLMASFKDAANFLRNPPGFGNDADNVFKYRTAALSSNTSIAASSYVSATVEPGTAVQSYNISEITSLARAKKQRTGSFVIASASTSVVTSAAQPGFFKAGTVSIKGASLTLAAGDSLAVVASKFNNISATTGITASIIQAGTNDFRLSFSATSTGTASDFDLNVPSTAVPTDASGIFSMISRTNLLTNGTFNSNITGWSNDSLGTGSITHNAGALELNGDGAGNEAFAKQAITTVIGQQYTVHATLSNLSSSAFIRVGTDADVNNVGNFDVANYDVAADGSVSFTFTATSTTSYVTFNSANNADPIAVDDVSVVANATEAFSTTQTASDAVLTIDGVTVTRDTNSITDVVDGVTLNLLSTTPPSTAISLNIEADKDLPKSGVLNFINAFNALKIFAAQQSQTNDDGTFAEDSYLATDSLLKNTLNSISNELTKISSSSGIFESLSAIGVTYSDLPKSEENPFTRNILTVNEEKLASALSESFDSVSQLFGASFTSTNTNVNVFATTNALNASTFTLNINPATSTYQATVGTTTYNLTATALGTSGYSLKGQEGTPLEGLDLIYASTTAGTSTVTISQGIADRIFNLADEVLDDQVGSLKAQVDSVESTTTRYETEIERITAQVDRFREQLISRFAALESVLSTVNTLLSSLDAQQNARNNAS